jgi:hypothetical protein
VERVERNTREKERASIVSFLSCYKLFVCWNKTVCFIPSECFKATTSGLSHQQLVSEPRSSENRSVFGRYPNFQSCHKHVLIIPPCRSHPYELTAAKISSIGHRRDPHAPPEDPVTVAQSHPRAPEEEDEWRPRAPYLSLLSRADPSRKPSLQPRRRIFPRIFPFQA